LDDAQGYYRSLHEQLLELGPTYRQLAPKIHAMFEHPESLSPADIETVEGFLTDWDKLQRVSDLSGSPETVALLQQSRDYWAERVDSERAEIDRLNASLHHLERATTRPERESAVKEVQSNQADAQAGEDETKLHLLSAGLNVVEVGDKIGLNHIKGVGGNPALDDAVDAARTSLESEKRFASAADTYLTAKGDIKDIAGARSGLETALVSYKATADAALALAEVLAKASPQISKAPSEEFSLYVSVFTLAVDNVVAEGTRWRVDAGLRRLDTATYNRTELRLQDEIQEKTQLLQFTKERLRGAQENIDYSAKTYQLMRHKPDEWTTP
jgi:hypothetical protein